MFDSNKLLNYTFYGNNHELVPYIFDKYEGIDLSVIWKTCISNNSDSKSLKNLMWLCENCDKVDLKFNDHMAFYSACKLNAKEKVEWIMREVPDTYFCNYDEDTREFIGYGIIQTLDIFGIETINQNEKKCVVFVWIINLIL